MFKLIQYAHKTVITAICIALIVVMMCSAAHFIKRQQTELSDNLQTITHQLIRQSSYSLGPLISSYSAGNDNSQQITTVLAYLSQQPWIVDIAVYQLNGALIAQAGEDISVRERLSLDSTLAVSSNTVQLVEKIDLAESPIGFIRVTLDPAALQINKNGANYTTKMIWFILMLSVCIGFILALTLQKWRYDDNVKKSNLKPSETQQPTEILLLPYKSDVDIK